MIQSVTMNNTARMLEARLRLVDRIRRVEYALARDEQANVAAGLMKGRSHELGNAIQIVKLSALELERRGQDRADLVELLGDLRQAADQATSLLAEMIEVARPPERTLAGPVVAHAVRAAVDLARAAVGVEIELRVDVDDTVHTRATAEELEAMVVAAMLDVSSPVPGAEQGATRMTLVVRERLIQNRRWVEILRVDDRPLVEPEGRGDSGPHWDGDLAYMFEPHSLLHVVAAVAKHAGGDASIAPGRGGLELAIELPVAAAPQSSSSS
jgi:hypothetical protein